MSDLKYFKEDSPGKSYIVVLLNPCFYSVLLYRLSHFLYKIKLGIFAKIIWLINRVIFFVDIDYSAKIGKNFMLVHVIETVIGFDVRIVDNCIIYTNSCIFGPVKVKPNARIKACQVGLSDIV